MAEDEPSIDEKERALVGVPDQTFWTVFDDAALAAATGERQIVVGKEPDQVRATAGTRPGEGLDIDADCAVRTEAGAPIPGLFAVGEVIGAGATCGNSFCSGMLLTPALTLGRRLGARLAGR